MCSAYRMIMNKLTFSSFPMHFLFILSLVLLKLSVHTPPAAAAAAPLKFFSDPLHNDILVNSEQGLNDEAAALKNVEVTAEVGHSGLADKEGDDDLSNLMGLEHECDENGDDAEECLKRRMMSEAHLDYIYTQHHKP